MSCKWLDESIIVLDTFRIDPPYNVVVPMHNNNKDTNGNTATNDAGLSRISKVVSIVLVFSSGYSYLYSLIFVAGWN